MSDEYIKKKDITNALLEKDFYPAFVRRTIENIPAADVVEVVRCKDCDRRVKSADLTDTVLCKWLHDLTMPKDGFCSYGTKKK